MFGTVLLLALLADGEPHAWSTRYEVHNWSIADGLPQTSVTGIAQDERGFLWLTTFGGLVRFDGESFERVTLSKTVGSPRFTAIAADGATLYLGTQGGRLWRIREHGEAIEELDLEPRPDAIWRILLRRSGTLVVAAGRAGVFELGATTRRVDERLALRVVERRDGSLWTMSGDGVACVEGCPSSALLPLANPSDLWLEDDQLLASGSEGLFTVTDGQLVQRSARHVGRGLWDPVKRQSWQVSDGVLLSVGSERTSQVFLPPPRLRADPTEEVPLAVRTLFVDAQNTLWVGTDNGGLYSVHDRFLRQLTPPEKARSVALVVPLDDEVALAAGYCAGLWRATLSERVIARDHRLKDDACVFSLSATDAGVLVGVTDRLLRLRGDELELLYEAPATRALEGVELKAVLEGEGSLLVGTSEGVWTLAWRDGGLERASVLGVDAGLPSAVVTSLARASDGHVLVGTQRGLTELVDGAVVPVLDGSDDRPVTVRDLLVEPSGLTWVATYGAGLARLEPQPNGEWKARWFTAEDGFCTNELSRVVALGDDLWFNSNAGTYRVRRAELEAFTTGRSASLACQHLASGEGNGGGMGAGGASRGGTLLFPTVEGVAVIRPSEVPTIPPALPIYLESAWLGRHRLPVSTPPASRDLEVRLSTPPDAFRAPPRSAWLTLKRDGVVVRHERGPLLARYVDLEPGEWVFEARPIDAPAGPPTAVATFTIHAQLLERTSVRVGLAVSLLAIALIAFRVVASRARALAQALEERERALAARSERDALQRALFDGSPAPLLTYRRGALERANPAARTMLALDESPATLPFSNDAEATRYASWLERDGAAADFTLAPNGERRLVRFQQARLGPDTSVVAALDLTAEHDAAQQREALLARTAHSQRLEGLGRLAAGVAHDFNNVLATLQLELDDVRRLPNSETVVSDMQASLDTGRRLTQRFLVFGKEADSAEALVLDDAVTRAWPMLERLLQPDVRLTLRCEATGVVVDLAAAHLDQLLLNLVVNAQEAVGSRGALEVRTAHTSELPEGTVIVTPPPAPWVVLSVRDSGRGMSPETLARAFEPFFSTKTKGSGTGMGLAVVHGVATRAKAGIVVASSVGRGTTLSVLFTPSQRAASPARPSAVEVPPRATAARVLLCEDNVQLRRALVRLFKSDGFEVVDVENGALGLLAFEQHPFDLVVTDLVMPELDGAQLIAALRAKGSTVPVILASGYPIDAIGRLDEASRTGVESIEKPWKGDALLRLARGLVSRSG